MSNRNSLPSSNALGLSKDAGEYLEPRSASVLPAVGVTLLLLDLAAVLVNLLMME